MEAQPLLGSDTLKLLAEDGMPEVVGELSRGPACAEEIEARVPGIPRWTATRRLQALRQARLAVVVPTNQPIGPAGAHARPDKPPDGRAGAHAHLDKPSDSQAGPHASPSDPPCEDPGGARPPGAHAGHSGETYALSELGCEFLPQLLAAARHWERTWGTRAPTDGRPPGQWAFRLLAHPLNRAIVDALADVPLRSSELEVHLPHVARSTLMRSLSALTDQGVLVRSERGGEVRYALSDGARRLPMVAIRAAHCEWCRDGGGERDGRKRTGERDAGQEREERAGPGHSGNLPGVVHMLAPLGSVASHVRGICRWRVESGAGVQADIHLSVALGHIATLSAPPVAAPEVSGRAQHYIWREALLREDPLAIETDGDEELFETVFAGLSAVLRGERTNKL